jgi:hypothetical protein
MNYSFQDVNLLIKSSLGSHFVTGFSNGSTITAARNSDKYTPHVGAKGDTTYAKTNDNSGTIVFTLKHDSPSNKILYQLAASDDSFFAQIVDGNDISRSKAGGGECVIMKPADYARGTEIAEQEWTISIPNLDMKYE